MSSLEAVYKVEKRQPGGPFRVVERHFGTDGRVKMYTEMCVVIPAAEHPEIVMAAYQKAEQIADALNLFAAHQEDGTK